MRMEGYVDLEGSTSSGQHCVGLLITSDVWASSTECDRLEKRERVVLLVPPFHTHLESCGESDTITSH